MALWMLSCSQKETTSQQVDVVPTNSETTSNGVDNPETTQEIFDSLPKEWTMLTLKDGKQIIYIPCDYQNQKLILKKEQGKLKLIHEIGQDGYYFDVQEIKKGDKEYTFLLHEAGNEEQSDDIIYQLKIGENYQGIWNLYNDERQLVDLYTTDSRFENNYKTIEEPPCLE